MIAYLPYLLTCTVQFLATFLPASHCRLKGRFFISWTLWFTSSNPEFLSSNQLTVKTRRKHLACCYTVKFLKTFWISSPSQSVSGWLLFHSATTFCSASAEVFPARVISLCVLRLNSAGSCRSPHLGLVFKTTFFNYKSQISPSGLMNVWKCTERCRQRAAGRSCLSQGAIQAVFVVPCRNTATCGISRGGPRAAARQAGGESPDGLFPHAGFLFFCSVCP